MSSTLTVRFYLNDKDGRAAGLKEGVQPGPDHLALWDCPCAPRVDERVQLKKNEWRRVIEICWRGPFHAIAFVSVVQRKA